MQADRKGIAASGVADDLLHGCWLPLASGGGWNAFKTHVGCAIVVFAMERHRAPVVLRKGTTHTQFHTTPNLPSAVARVFIYIKWRRPLAPYNRTKHITIYNISPPLNKRITLCSLPGTVDAGALAEAVPIGVVVDVVT